MKSLGAVIVTGLLLFVPAAMAQEASPGAATQPPEEKKICRRVTPTGSVMSKRVCLTAAEWKKLNGTYDRQSAALQESQGRNRAAPQ